MWTRHGSSGALLFEPAPASVKDIHIASDAELAVAKLAQGAADTILRTEGAETAPEWGKVLSAMCGFTHSTYVPAFSADGGSPSVGNASIAGMYFQLGKLIVAQFEMVPGTTTNFGSGTMHFGLPVAAAAGQTPPVGISQCYDVSTNNLLQPVVHISSNTSFCHLQYPGSTNNVGALTTVAATTPWTWTNGDVIRWSVVYRAA